MIDVELLGHAPGIVDVETEQQPVSLSPPQSFIVTPTTS
jgi:hypothetical protein